MDSAIERLGSVKAIDTGSAARDVADSVNMHRNAILEVAGDTQRLHDRISKMVPEMQEKLAQAKREAKAEWVPEGSAADLDARYLLPNGDVRLGREIVKIALPDGGTFDHVRQGLLTEPHTVTPEHERARNAYLSFAMARAIAKKRDGFGKIVERAYVNFARAMMDLPGRVGEWAKRAFTDPALVTRIVSNSSGQGGELVSVPTIADIRRPTDLARRVAGLVPMEEVVASSFKPPIVTGRALARKRGATGDDPARYPIQRFTTSDSTVTVVDRVVNVLLDDQWASEGGMVLGDPMGFVRDWIEAGDADTLELAFLHGDTAATHQDTIATWTQGSYYTSGDLSGSTTPLAFWIGFRARAFDDSCTVAGGGTFDAADHYGALALMGSLAEDATMFVGLYGFYTQLLANALFTTVDKFGPNATLTTGMMGQVGKTPIVISQFLANEYASSGLYTGSGATNTFVYANAKAYRHYHHAGGEMDWDVSYPEKGAQYVGIKRRSVLSPACLSTEKPCAAIINL